MAGFRGAIALCAGLGVAGCTPMALPPTAAPEAAPAPQTRPDARPRPSAASEAVRAHFARQEAQLRARGLMRTDDGREDAPFGVAMLVHNFERIALYDEYVEIGGRLVGRETPSRLRRWESPVRLALEFGDSVPEAQRRRDTQTVRDYAARLAGITGHPVRVVDTPATANFRVLVLNEDERRAAERRLTDMLPGIDRLSVDTVTGLPLTVSCLVLAFARGGSSVYSQAVAVIRAELPDLTRLSCFHEELAQGLGLPNDHAGARPSIFNDVQEFALLTPHDELLLRILYDDRLRPGMTPSEARPIVEAIASEMLAGES